MKPRKYWFAAHRFGWGWHLPLTWQGWLSYGLYFSLALFGSAVLSRELFLVYVGALSVLMILVCWLKGEPPRWR